MAGPEPRHLGDGVYVSFDGYQLWLAVNDHRHKVVALEPSVLAALTEYARSINTWNNPAIPYFQFNGSTSNERSTEE